MDGTRGTRRYLVLGLVLAAAIFAGWAPGIDRPASANDVTPTEAAVSTPEPTVAIATDTGPAATPVEPAPVKRERARPIATIDQQPVASVGPTSPGPPVRIEQGLGQPTPIPTSVKRRRSGPTNGSESPVPAEAPLPSPDELRQNARLRWGKGIPSAVRRWAFLIVPAAHKYHLKPGLIAAVMTMESGGDPLAYSSADARGLMQVLHGPWDPRANVFRGARMLAAYYELYSDWTLALAAYNAGPAAVDEYDGVPPFRETRDYVIVVTYLWDLYSHRRLTRARRVLYHRVLRDLEDFGKERKKIARLAKIAHIHDAPLLCVSSCGAAHESALFETLDPFWPLNAGPDPLQHVDALSGGF